jgi:glycosyltransferase involved in cell wall biosynthesis
VTWPLVTVLITNHNYGRYLGAAVESALAQSYPHVKVVVVDDGSVDDSRRLLSTYDGRATCVYKETGGQGSAISAGFSQSRGAIITLLDADDVLLPDTVERAVRCFRDSPLTSLVQCRIELADQDARPLGIYLPAAHIRMPQGDLRRRFHHLNTSSWWSPTSGISVSAEALGRFLPFLSGQEFRISADYFISRSSALCGPVASLEDIGAYCRIHDSNEYRRAAIDVEKMHQDVMRIVGFQRHLLSFAREVGVDEYPRSPYEIDDAIFLSQRMALLKLGSRRHRVDQDTLLRVTRHGVRAALRRPDVNRIFRLFHAAWFVLMLAAPTNVARWLANEGLVELNQRYVPLALGLIRKLRPPRSQTARLGPPKQR